MVLSEKGKYVEAEQIYREVVEVQETGARAGSIPTTLTTMSRPRQGAERAGKA